MLPKSLKSQIRRLVDRLAPIEGVSTLNALVFQLSSHAHLCSVSSIYLSCPPFMVLEQCSVLMWSHRFSVGCGSKLIDVVIKQDSGCLEDDVS